MNLPPRNRHWLKESLKALESAEKRSKKEATDLELLYLYALEYIVKNRGIRDSETIEDIKEHIQSLVDQDCGVDPNSKRQYKFHFVSSYVHGHVAAGLIDEIPADNVLDYVNHNTNLFIDAPESE